MNAVPIEARQRISEAAFRLFGQKGYTRTSIQDIADAAEVKKSIVYYYFDSKEGLYQALLTESGRHLREFLEQAVESAAPTRKKGGEAQLTAIAETLISLARDNREPVRFFLSHIFAPDADRPFSSSDECVLEPSRLIQQIAAAALQSGELAGDAMDLERLVLGAVQYSIIRHLRNPAEEPLTAGLGQRIVRAAMRGFVARGAVQANAQAASQGTTQANSPAGPPADSCAASPARHGAAALAHADTDPG
jgi:AcrR family transcriptional regulator